MHPLGGELKILEEFLASEGMLLSAYLGHRDREFDVNNRRRHKSLMQSFPQFPETHIYKQFVM